MNVRINARGRLEDWRTGPTGPAYWAEYFSKANVRRELEVARSTGIGDIGEVLRRHLPRRGLIVEAGCGLGRVVAALRSWGYDCAGIDSSRECIARALELMPDLPVAYGDARALDFPDASTAGCISLGVIEHERAGPQPFLAEMHRVLQPGGVAVVSVPFENGVRRLKKRLGLYPCSLPEGDWQFYQHVFSRETFVAFAEGAGFELLREYDVGAGRGLSREFRLMRRLEELSPSLWWQIVRPWHYVAALKSLVANMHVVVARKPVA
ncbi:MAG TPA: class I SAM-dependent methyltransferase [Planctomycetota bacterium]|nr:class I SAM-dependent methyltransferase [Planctomycetota bacterium]